jgi:sialic acid synthase SpsE
MHLEFDAECRRAGIKPLTTIFSRSRIPFIASLGWGAVKVASYDCASLPMLRELGERFEQLFISTGATYDHEIEAAAHLMQSQQRRFSLLHAVTIYPTPLNEAHLARMEALRRYSPSVGWSDHTLTAKDGIKASQVALSLGADVIERHFTILASDATRDGPVSIRPTELKALVEFSRLSPTEMRQIVVNEIPEAAQMIGQQVRPLSQTELLNRDYYRGRFASRVAVGSAETGWVYNWEEKEAF